MLPEPKALDMHKEEGIGGLELDLSGTQASFD
jgi:hypothetical protein